jgi:hypothetical protein
VEWIGVRRADAVAERDSTDLRRERLAVHARGDTACDQNLLADCVPL